MKTRIADRESALEQASEEIFSLVREKPEAAIALSAHGDCLELYRLLSRRPELFDRARFFALTEFEDLSPEDARSCRSRLRKALLDTVDPGLERSVFLSADAAEGCDAQIAQAGGLDLAVVGLGERGRVGFNEPATPFDSPTHRQKLTKATRRELAPVFGGEERVPGFGLTMGIRTIVQARRILVIALGEERADSVFRMLYARDDSFVPAAFLQLPPQVSVYLDEAAAQKL